MHGSTGDMILLGTITDELEPTFSALTELGFDLGGSGSAVRTPSCCVGQARCEWACYDTMALTYDITQHFQDDLHRPAYPYKFKFKMAGCPNDCVASIARSDLSIIGIWRDDIRINQDALKEYAANGKDIQADVIENCPTKCMEWDGTTLKIDNSNCTKCMHCINVLPKALRPGTDTGACLLLGSKAPIVDGALLSSVIVPFIKIEPPYDELYDIAERIIDVWSENGKNRERVGEFIQRVGLGNFLEEVEIDPIPEMISAPRDNPYIFFEEYYEEDDEEEEEE
jgi:sulfite reductase alpha subunit